jgi:hypothetical protein
VLVAFSVPGARVVVALWGEPVGEGPEGAEGVCVEALGGEAVCAMEAVEKANGRARSAVPAKSVNRIMVCSFDDLIDAQEIVQRGTPHGAGKLEWWHYSTACISHAAADR